MTRLAAIVAAIVAPTLAQAQPCGFGPAVEAMLADEYGESIAGTGVAKSGATWTALYVNADTGTWTLVSVQLSGRMCLLASGVSWDRHPFPPPGEDG